MNPGAVKAVLCQNISHFNVTLKSTFTLRALSLPTRMSLTNWGSLQMLTGWLLSLSHTLTNEQVFHYLALYGRLVVRAIHWSVHLSLSCPLCLTVKTNGKHSERTWTQRCISACQACLDCSSNLYLLCLENLMPLLDIECCIFMSCEEDGIFLCSGYANVGVT